MATFTVPGYRVDDLVSARGPAEVWRGRTVDTDAPVALRRVHVPDPERLRTLYARAVMISRVEHPHLLPVLDVVTLREWLVVVQPWAGGGTMADVLTSRQRLTPGEVITTFAPVAEALGFAHTADLVHATIRAEHIVFGDHGFPMLARLGTADWTDEPNPDAAGAAEDVLALGWLAVRALTGPGSGRLAGSGPVDDPSVLVQALAEVGVPESVARALAGALAPRPSRVSAGEFSAQLRASGTARPVVLSEAGPGSAGQTPIPQRRDHSGIVHWVRVPPGGASPPTPPHGPPQADHPPSGSDAVTTPAGRGRHAAAPAQRARALPRRPAGAVLASGVLATVVVLAAGVKAHRGGGTTAPVRPRPSSAAALSTRPATAAPSSSGPTLDRRDHGGEAFSALDALARVRSYAYQKRMPSLLHNVYDSADLERADAAMLARLVPVGCALFGLNTSFSDISVLAYSPRSMTVQASTALSPTTLVCAGAVTGRSAASGPRRMVVVLNRVGGRLEVGSESYR
jgi:hypothetical protein